MKQGRETRREEGECIKREERGRKEGKKKEEERLNVTLIKNAINVFFHLNTSLDFR